MSESLEALEQKLLETPPAPDPRPRINLLIEVALRIREQERWDYMCALATEARTLSEQIGYTYGIVRGITLQAFIQYIHADYRNALASCMNALQTADEDTDAEGRIRSILGMVHWSLGNFEEALRQTDRSRTLLRQIGDQTHEGFVYATRGGILQSLGEYDQALAAHEKSLELFKESGSNGGIARALAGIGSVYQALGRWDEAFECQKASLEIAQSIKHYIGMSRALNDLGELYEAKGNYDQALELHRQALEMRRANGYRQSQVTSLFNIGRIHRRRGDLAHAIEIFSDALAIAEEIEAKPKVCQLHHALAETYELDGRLLDAVVHLKACDRTKTALASDQSALRHKALELESQLEFARKDAEIHRLKTVELARLIEQLQITQAELVNSEKMAALGGLVAAVAHEINSPLGVIRSSADTAVRCAERITGMTDGKARAALDALFTNTRLIADATRRIETTVGRLKSFAGIDRAEYTNFDLIAALEDTLALLESDFRGRIETPREYGVVPRVYGYAAEIAQVFTHLIRNAAQAMDGTGVIVVRTDCDNKNIRVSIKDSGRGIAAQDIPRLFNPGFNSSDHRVKASLSLFTCLAIVRKHGGDIQVDSQLGQGSTFTVLLPRTLEHAEYDLPLAAST